MITKQIYDLAIQLGIKYDLRGVARVKKNLERLQKKYDELGQKAQETFDKDKLTNPYSDSLILVDNNKKQIKKVLAGIDMEGA